MVSIIIKNINKIEKIKKLIIINLKINKIHYKEDLYYFKDNSRKKSLIKLNLIIERNILHHLLIITSGTSLNKFKGFKSFSIFLVQKFIKKNFVNSFNKLKFIFLFL